jgi:cytochrome c-type biogenesis protein
MIETVFNVLYQSVQSASIIALPGSFAWGVLSIILSPCHLASIPLIVGFIDSQGRISAKRSFFISTLFAAGILISIAVIGIVTAAAGRMLGDIGQYGNYFIALIFFVIGFHLLGYITLPFSGPDSINIQRKGLFAAFLIGSIFGLALGPCTFAFMAPLLSVTFLISDSNMLFGIFLLIMYGAGHCSVIILAGTFTNIVQKYIHWNEHSKGSVILRKVCGILVIFGGIYLIYIVS